MKMVLMAAAAALSMTAGATAAHADTLTFSDLTASCYGFAGSCPLLPNMTFDGNNLTYTSGDYRLSFAGGPSAHIADGTGTVGTYNWHDGPANATGSVVSLSRVDGAAFDLTAFDYYSDGGLTVSALGNVSLFFAAGAGGTSTNGFANVTSVAFAGPADNQLDNIVVSAATGAVPEPATWAMMMLGFGGMGYAMRRKTKVSTRIKFA